MRITVVVLHRGSLAHYSVSDETNGCMEAHLLKYGGSSELIPPPRIRFVKSGRHCSGDTAEQELMDELCAAIQYKK